MKSSIRKFLLINLLLAITITTTLTAIGNYYLDQKDIQDHLDSLMAVSALSYQALLGDDLHQRPLSKIQEALETIPQKIDTYYQKRFLNEEPPENYLDKFNFQVWTNGGKLLLHSSSAPKIPLTSEVDGFSDKKISKQDWRVFTTYNEKAGIRTVLAERYDTRNELGHRIAQDDLYIMLLTFPLSGLLIWIIIGRGLDSLDKVAEEVANRAPSHLEPVDLHEVPEEIKPVIDELNKLFFRLKEGFEREKRFAADAAHELRTPLAALKTQAQVALHSNDIEEKNQALQKLIASVNRSTHIVQQLLTMSRLVPEAAHMEEKDEVNLSRLTREILAMLAPAAVEKQIDLEFESDAENLTVFGNSTALGILIRNLVDNAIRYSNEHGRIIVRLAKLPNEIMLEVSDNGPGIPAELQPRVFERFFRVLGNKSPGSGLGLAIVQQIAELHGGRLMLDTPKEGTGLIVRFFLPFQENS
ncbi:ATP-binding protein [Fluoribacter dumoffii]|uniref:histidine kinase n=1 Tax=Fluoribacter dumoffii TaxID=463 RepID=A0A377G8M5_9GAMM|nr:ATP-binding protein [Fluoribacter dumoffii]KTC90005.1 sensory histidine kinase in two-component regulatory system with QseB [Fluoribacter dumoffii NY 23]MCW8385303.1 ATP-binding protein [Fluoribacter dumoffii]MCW8418357.1 ATP-binding protein [Fluoribacter dumoffii]MCW8453801.1 ATP-binding protein [Fluoribacter dumoffii]MCW8462128.1 ATP-binding protein [Fluoribacter dumoffii]